MDTTEIVSGLGKNKKDGSSMSVGVPYQNVPSLGLAGHRDFSDQRARLIMERVDMTGKTVADLGCSVGTMSSIFGTKATSVTGYDHDDVSIALASSLYNTNTHFECVDLTLEFLDKMPEVDVVVWTSQFMWMVKQHGTDYALDFLWKLSKKCNVLVFETAGMEDGSAPLNIMQDEVINILLRNTVFQNVRDYGPWNDGWFPRNLFVCSEPLISHYGEWSSVQFPKRGIAVKVFKDNDFSRELKARESMFLKKLSGYRHFPKVISEDDRSITMNYSGPRAQWLPEDDIRYIYKALDTEGITHRDIRPENLLWNGVHAVLVDFSFAVMEKEVTNYHYDLGGSYKCPYGFNDEYSLRKIQAEMLRGK